MRLISQTASLLILIQLLQSIWILPCVYLGPVALTYIFRQLRSTSSVVCWDCAWVSFSPSWVIAELLPRVFESHRKAVGTSFHLLCEFVLASRFAILCGSVEMWFWRNRQGAADITKCFGGSNTQRQGSLKSQQRNKAVEKLFKKWENIISHLPPSLLVTKTPAVLNTVTCLYFNCSWC